MVKMWCTDCGVGFSVRGTRIGHMRNTRSSDMGHEQET